MTKWFKKWSSKAGLRNRNLLDALEDLENGLSTADLGGHLYKVRVKSAGGGKRSGFRTIVVYKKGDRAIFLYGFGKNERANIDTSELHYFKKLGDDLLSLNVEDIERLVKQRKMFDLEADE